ncbi:YceH family protein [Pseudomonas nicosulfuronedens]
MSQSLDTLSDFEPLSAVDTRVLGCLIEKQLTTPEAYPLTLNALVTACNQKTSRDPVLNLTPGQVGQSLRHLEGREMTRLVMGSRADRWEQRLDKALELVKPQVILLGLLFLRGPQTLNELLTRSQRMHDFDDIEEVRHQLERLAGRGMAVQLERQSGQREDRYMHLLGTEEDREAAIAASGSRASSERNDGGGSDEGRLVELEGRIAALEERLALLELGISRD